MADAKIRYFCLVLPNGGGQMGYSYLEALDRTLLGVRACPIGPCYLQAEPWVSMAHLFLIGQVDKVFVNVVCAPPNLLMGTALKMVAEQLRMAPDGPMSERALPPVIVLIETRGGVVSTSTAKGP